MPINVLAVFIAFLNMTEEALKQCIDFYNSGMMDPQAMLALEAVEALAED